MSRVAVVLAVLTGCLDPGATDGSTATELTPPTTRDTDDPPSDPTDTDGGGDTDLPATPPDDSVQQLCVDEINAWRDTLGLPPYERWVDAEPCADGEAEADSISGEPHGAFGACGEWAQNECPGWPLPYEAVIEDCLAMMWAEGPGADFQEHGHFINMSSTTYTKVACGFHTTPGGSVWAVQDFQ